MDIKVIKTEDGSHSLYRADLNETYHSFHGALQESIYVYIKQGLDFVRGQKEGKISILEIGFGTGLNILLTIAEAVKSQLEVEIVTIEPFPLERDVFTLLNYPEQLSKLQSSPIMDYKGVFDFIHEAPWKVKNSILENASLTKIMSTFQDFEPDCPFDLVYFDAFAPSKQADIWTPEIFEKIFKALNSKGVIVTYCAQGQFKRNLSAAGFQVESLKGPLGKKEMVRGKKD